MLQVLSGSYESSSKSRDTNESASETRALPSPRKSALKNPKNKSRKSESIKFDLSNLPSEDSSSVLLVTDAQSDRSLSSDNITLHYSNTSPNSPSPRKPIHSRSSKILEMSLGNSFLISPTKVVSSVQTIKSPNIKPSSRTSFIMKKAVEDAENNSLLSQYSFGETINKSKISSSSKSNLESYSIVDLISNDSKEISVYNSADSTNGSVSYGTPNKNSSRRNGNSSIAPTIIGSSTPYAGRTPRASARKAINNNTFTQDSRSLSTPLMSIVNVNTTRRSKSLTTPVKMDKTITIRTSNRRSTRGDGTFASSRYSGGDNTTAVLDESPKSSKSHSRSSAGNEVSSPATPVRNSTRNISKIDYPIGNVSRKQKSSGQTTPEYTAPPEEFGTPILKIQNLLNSSHTSVPRSAVRKKSLHKTIGPHMNKNKVIVLRGPRTDVKRRSARKSAGLNLGGVKKVLLRRQSNNSGASDKTDENAPTTNNEENVTPKSTVKLIQEAVKHQHSTAKKPVSKRSIIDNLNDSDIVKQLFNSPVKRKLSQSMTEFSRNQHSDDETGTTKKRTRRTIALITGSPNQSFDRTVQTPTVPTEVFVSPLTTPGKSPNTSGVKNLLAKNTPRQNTPRQNTPLQNTRKVKGVKTIVRSPRSKKSPKNDLTNVSGVKAIFKEARSPRNDLRRVTGVKSLFRSQKEVQTKDDLTDVRGVKGLFVHRKSPCNDLTNVHGVKKILTRTSPRNDLRDVRGVKRMFGEEKPKGGLEDLSGVEELFDVSHSSRISDPEKTFDMLVGKPVIKATYSKSVIEKKTPNKTEKLASKSLSVPLDIIVNNIEEWLEKELEKRVHKDASEAVSSKTLNYNKANITRELQKLATDTVEGTTPIKYSRLRRSAANKTHTVDSLRNSSSISDRNSLPFKKRSLVVNKTNDSYVLPIKKRVIVHSTPVKGKRGTLVVATEMGRVSPIAAEKTLEHELTK